MLAYVLYSKDLGLVFKALETLRDKDLKFDVDLDHGYIYINEAEASRPKLDTSTLLESLVVPRRCFLRTVKCNVDNEGNIQYGSEGSGVSTGTSGLLDRIRNTRNIEIMKGLIYYSIQNAFWVTGEGYFSVERMKDELRSGHRISPKVLKYWKILNKLVTID
jgi:hypothetical protein